MPACKLVEMPRSLVRPTRGVSLVELLVGMVIALMVLGVALQLTLIARERYLRLADEALIEDRGMQALELIGRAVRQAGWITDTPSSSPIRRWPNADANIPPSLLGKDGCRPKMQVDLECGTDPVRNSDALQVRFAGRGTQSDGRDSHGATIDCAGYSVPERIGGDDDPRLGSMLLYVSLSGVDNEPQLMCRSFARGSNTPTTGQSYGMVRGVETLQLLYTLASGQIKSARDIQTEEWAQVRKVHAALVVRGERFALRPPISRTIALFPGLSVSSANQQQDLNFRPTDPRRNRTIFTVTVAVRNALRCEVDAC